MYIALQRAKVPVELRIFGNGNHDFGVRKGTKLAASWMELCVKWLRNYGTMTPGAHRLSPTIAANSSRGGTEHISAIDAHVVPRIELHWWSPWEKTPSMRRCKGNARVGTNHVPS